MAQYLAAHDKLKLIPEDRFSVSYTDSVGTLISVVSEEIVARYIKVQKNNCTSYCLRLLLQKLLSLLRVLGSPTGRKAQCQLGFFSL